MRSLARSLKRASTRKMTKWSRNAYLTLKSMRRSLAKVFSQMLVKMTRQTTVDLYNRQTPLCQARWCLMKILDKAVVYIMVTFSHRKCIPIICLCLNPPELFLDLMHLSLNSSSLLLSQRLAWILSMGSLIVKIKFCLLKRIEKFQKFLTKC